MKISNFYNGYQECFWIVTGYEPMKMVLMFTNIMLMKTYNGYPLRPKIRRFPHILSLNNFIMAARQGCLSITKYHAQFKSMIEAMSTGGGAIELHPCISNMIAKEMFPDLASGRFTDAQKTAVKAQSRGYFVGNFFLWLSDPTCFGDLVLQLKDDYIHGVNNFPGSLQAAVTLMQAFENNHIRGRSASSNRHKPHHGKAIAQPHANRGASSDTKSTGASLYNDTTATPPSSSGPADDYSSISTKKSGKTKTTKTGSTSVHFATVPPADCADNPELFTEFSFAQYDDLISNTWILLDN
jgi:hypothetical protein